MKTIYKDVKVGIYDAQYIAKIHHDKIIVKCPSVKWVGDTGSLTHSTQSIRDQEVIDQVSKELDDDCEVNAWILIAQSTGDQNLKEIFCY